MLQKSKLNKYFRIMNAILIGNSIKLLITDINYKQTYVVCNLCVNKNWKNVPT